MSERRAKAAPRATQTSDVTRARTLALAAAGTALGAAASLAIARPPLGADRPRGRPHAAAKVACAKCHEPPASAAPPASSAASPFAAAGACKGCHGATAHASTRAPHRALAARGELACATCHPAHDGAQGVTFEGEGRFVRWGAGASSDPASTPSGAGLAPGTTVPLVALAACARCHDVASAREPVARCIPAAVRLDPSPARLRSTASVCLDEHASAPSESEPAGRPLAGVACSRQHAPDRFVAWDAAREVAAATAWVERPPPRGGAWPPVLGAALGASLLGLGASVHARRRRRAPPVAPAAVVPAERRRLPVVDPSTCLGCYACVDACPFDVLAIERYVAVVARPEECCGVVLCEQVCPNGSLRIAEGEPVLDRPAVDEHLESRDVPGLFLAGDLTGLPLIKNAINQGVRAVDRIAGTLTRRHAADLDVLVVGGGPAGLSAALRAKEKGLSCLVLEQASVAASIKSFPRDKIVHDPPLDLPVEGELWLRESTKEELLAQWTRIVRARALDVREGHRVTHLAREGDGFVVEAEASGAISRFVASRVVLAIGRRGTPRALDLEIERGAEERVAYALADARSFAGKRVLVVGLGDSAMEAAVALARQPGTSVTVSYRGSGFRRGKARNIGEVKELLGKGALRILFETVPVRVGQTGVVLRSSGGGTRTVAADAVLVLIGGATAWDLLTRAGIRRPTAEPDPPAPGRKVGAGEALSGENLREPGA